MNHTYAILLSSLVLASCGEIDALQHNDSHKEDADFLYEGLGRNISGVNGIFIAEDMISGERYRLGRINDCSNVDFLCTSSSVFRLAVPRDFSTKSYEIDGTNYESVCVGQTREGACGSVLITYRYDHSSELPYQQGFFTFEPGIGIRMIGLVRADPQTPSDATLGDIYILKEGDGLLSE